MRVLPDKVEISVVVEMLVRILAAVVVVEPITTMEIMVATVALELLYFVTKHFQFMLKPT